MAIKIRLRRMGRKKQAHYRIVVADSNSPRDGRFVESLGYYKPLSHPARVVVDMERVDHWIGQGAQPSETVSSLLKRVRRGGDASIAVGEVDKAAEKQAAQEALAAKRRAEAEAQAKEAEAVAAPKVEKAEKASAEEAPEAEAQAEEAPEAEAPAEEAPEAAEEEAPEAAAEEAPEAEAEEAPEAESAPEEAEEKPE